MKRVKIFLIKFKINESNIYIPRWTFNKKKKT